MNTPSPSYGSRRDFVLMVSGAQLREPFIEYFDSLPYKTRVKLVRNLLRMITYKNSPLKKPHLRQIDMIFNETQRELDANPDRYDEHGSYFHDYEVTNVKRILTMLEKGQLNGDHIIGNARMVLESLGIDPELITDTGLVKLSKKEIKEIKDKHNLHRTYRMSFTEGGEKDPRAIIRELMESGKLTSVDDLDKLELDDFLGGGS